MPVLTMLFERRFDLFADVHDIRAARVEPAGGWRVE